MLPAITLLLRDEANLLRISRNNDSGQLYYTAYPPVDPNLAVVTLDFYGPPELRPFNPFAGGAVGWGAWTPSFTDYRDDKVTLFPTYLPAGAYEYTFLVRASLPSEFRVLPVHGEMM